MSFLCKFPTYPLVYFYFSTQFYIARRFFQSFQTISRTFHSLSYIFIISLGFQSFLDSERDN